MRPTGAGKLRRRRRGTSARSSERSQEEISSAAMGARRDSSSLPTSRSKVSFLPAIVVVLVTLASSAALLLLLPPTTATGATTLPSGFQESVVFSGLNQPMDVEFSGDGKVFVAEKSGIIKVFDGLSDATPTVFADLRTNVYNRADRGVEGMAVDPNFPTKPYVYVLYAYDAPIGGVAPYWGQPGVTSDPCPTPPGATEDGCVVSGRLSRLTADGNAMVGGEKVLVEDWCQQYPSHSVGALAFGADGALYASGGEGAAYNFSDYGQRGDPLNPCGDPPAGVGGTQSPPTAEGGRLRSQDLRTAGDPVGLSGTVVRLDPATGDALPDNPLAANSDPNARRIVAYGLRNPFRFTIRPGTNEVWIGDVGGGPTEEINTIMNPKDPAVKNFGWPCYNDTTRASSFDSLDLNMCENLYAQPGAVAGPYYFYHRNQPVVAGETCGSTQQAISGLAFYDRGGYPADYNGALFFADYGRGCIWTMFKGADGKPDPAKVAAFAQGAASPVDLEIGPGGDLFYASIGGGSINRIRYTAGGNQPPVARATANPTSGPAPLMVNFDGTGSSDPDGDTLSYEWDLDGDGAYDDSTSPNPTHTYSTEGDYNVGLKVTDGKGVPDVLDQPLTISAGNSSPTATIDTPLPTTTWKVGDEISFSGRASDPQEGELPASALSWSVLLHHCTAPDACHQHPVQDFQGVASGSFAASDHGYPSYFEVRLTATDSTGLTDTKSVRLDPKTVEMTFQSDPSGLSLVVGDNEGTTPFRRTVIVGSANSVSATSPQTLGGASYKFVSWSDGGAQSHDIVATSTPSTYTATYELSATPAPPSVDLAAASDTGTLSTDDVTRDSTPTFTGGAEAGSTVKVYDGERLLGQTVANTGTADPAGNKRWELTVANIDSLSDGAHQITATATNAAGNVSAASGVLSVTVDTGAPAAQAPVETLVSYWTLNTTSAVPVKLDWSATDGGSGVSKYQLQQSTNGSTPTAVSLSSSTSTNKQRYLSPGNAYQFRVRAMDVAGNWSGWASGPQFVVDLHQDDATVVGYPSGTWTGEALSSASGGGVKYALASDARATFTFTGGHVAWVTHRDANRGKAQVWLDGVRVKTIDLYKSAAQPRSMVFTKGFGSSGSHTLEVRVTGTMNSSSSGTRVDVDAFVVLRYP